MATQTTPATGSGLDAQGLHPDATVHWSLVAPRLNQHAIRRGEDEFADMGPLAIRPLVGGDGAASPRSPPRIQSPFHFCSRACCTSTRPLPSSHTPPHRQLAHCPNKPPTLPTRVGHRRDRAICCT